MHRFAFLLSIAWLVTFTSIAAAQESSSTAAPQADKKNELALRQGRIADKYARLEQLMLKMAEIDGAANPKRAELLKQAVQQSKEKLTRSQLDAVVKLLDQQKLKRAVDGQSQATSEMKALLELLLSENRADRNKGDQDRVKEYIKEVERLIRLQKDVQGRMEGEANAKEVTQDQAKVADRTGELAKKIQENEEAPPTPESKQPADTKPDEKPPGEQQPPMPADKPEDKPAEKPEDKPGDDAKPGDKPDGPMKSGETPMPGDSSKSESKPGTDQPMPGQGQSSPMNPPPMPPAEENPARKRLQQAEQKMRDAQKKLEESQKNEAKEAQEAARQELEKAKAELEEILRQLREEEIERTLAQLETRFRRMLEMQIKVHDATQRLESIPVETRGREVDIEAGKQAIEERKIALEADKAYNLLLEEGSSIAFTESVEQIRIDMEQVADRLSKSQVDKLTLGVEEEIITALQEMIQALQQAQKDQEKKKQEQEQQAAPPPGEEQEQPLVDKIAELKMIKAMQLRVNERTQRFAKLIATPEDPTGQATEADLQQAIEKLGDRQSKLQRITRDIVLGKNQ
ncbi:MAG TPA: hypothetical protein VL096_20490 [Pirellulaceae bacterium]|nr:hypothetical protein [Pirellulaceae bacterium]